MLTDPELDAAAALAGELAERATALVRAAPPRAYRTKTGAADLVTDLDVEIERFIVSAVLEQFPGHRVVGEETGASGADPGAPTWYVDPVDGTTNLAHGIGWCSVSLALADAGGPAVGLVADPYRREVFSAVRGRGALLGRTPLRCGTADRLAGQVVTSEWSGHRPWPGMFELLARLAECSATTRIMGSSAMSVALVAAGRAAGAVIGAYQDIDDLAAVLIAREAGAVVLGRDGGPTPAADGVLVAAPGVAAELYRCWVPEERETPA